MKYQNELNSQMNLMNKKIADVENSLLRYNSHKLSDLSFKLNTYIQSAQTKIQKILYSFQNMNSLTCLSSLKNDPFLNHPSFINLLNQMKTLQNQIYFFKTKEFQYDNINISILQKKVEDLNKEINSMQEQVGRRRKSKNFQANEQNVNNRSFQNFGFDTSHFSRIEDESSHFFSHGNNTILGMNENNHGKIIDNSALLFDDYIGNQYSESNSMETDGEFFHPMSSSFQKQSNHYQPPQPLTHTKQKSHHINNDSFENFTSEDQEQDILISPLPANSHKIINSKSNHQILPDNSSLLYSKTSSNKSNYETENQIRIKRMFMNLKMRLPVKVEVFADGKMRIFGSQFLADENDEYLRVSKQQIKRLRVSGFIQY